MRAFKLYTGPDNGSHVLEGTIDEQDRTDVTISKERRPIHRTTGALIRSRNLYDAFQRICRLVFHRCDQKRNDRRALSGPVQSDVRCPLWTSTNVDLAATSQPLTRMQCRLHF